ncbi:MAG: ATP-grasp domain-containing protein [Symploca sp. SIO3E6]|nr:ATP-grasp domain-containing protein [Caldora sp. SIO3E6]
MANYVITGNSFRSGLLDELSSNSDYQIFDQQELSNSDVFFNTEDKIYVTFEGVIDEVYKHHKDTKWVDKIKLMRNKYEFRKVLKSIYPNFYFEKISSKDITQLKIINNKKFVIKPVYGFMATGVNFTDRSTDLEQIKHKLQEEIAQSARYFNDSVVSSKVVIIEEFIDGEEYASDCYINSEGEVVILNITAHPTHEKFHYMQALYHTNYQIFSRLYDKIKYILSEFHSLVDISNIPIHAEFKFKDEKLIPIEFNPLRFGGMGYADLTYYFFEVNPFKVFFEGQNIAPSQLWQGRYDKYFGWVLAYNGKGLNLNHYEPDYDKIQSKFTNVLKLKKIDYQNSLAFAVLYVEEKKLENLMQVLKFEFKDFFKKISA